MLKKLALVMLLLLFLVTFLPACAPFEPTTRPGIDKDIFTDPGLKDSDESERRANSWRR